MRRISHYKAGHLINFSINFFVIFDNISIPPNKVKAQSTMGHRQAITKIAILLLLSLKANKVRTLKANISSAPGEQHTLVFKYHGTMLKPKGLLALSTNTRLISVFLKIKIPQLRLPIGCDSTWAKSGNNLLVADTFKFIDLFKHIAQPGTRKKRFLGALAIGLSAVDLLLGGLSYSHLNSQISKVESKLNTFLTKQHDLNQHMLEIDEDIVTMVTVLQSRMSQQMQKMECKVLDTTGVLMAAQIRNEWRDKLKTLFAPILSGGITQGLTPEIIEPRYLRAMLEKHRLLGNSFFTKNLYNMYKVTKITIAGAKVDHSTKSLALHQILSFPLANEDTLLPYYHVSQTGFRRNNKCFILDLPPYLYKNNNTFFMVDGINCDLTKTLATCYMPLLKHELHNTCLQDFDKCKLSQTTCDTHYIYDNSGILISTADNITAFHNTFNGGERSIKNVPTTIVGTAFLPWDEIDYVQVGDLFIEQPNSATTALQLSFDTYLLDKWNKIINLTALEIEQINSSIILDEIAKAKTTTLGQAAKPALLYTPMLLGMLAIGILAGYFIRQKFCRKINCVRKQNTPPQLPEQANPLQSSPLIQTALDSQSINIIPN